MMVFSFYDEEKLKVLIKNVKCFLLHLHISNNKKQQRITTTVMLKVRLRRLYAKAEIFAQRVQ